MFQEVSQLLAGPLVFGGKRIGGRDQKPVMVQIPEMVFKHQPENPRLDDSEKTSF